MTAPFRTPDPLYTGVYTSYCIRLSTLVKVPSSPPPRPPGPKPQGKDEVTAAIVRAARRGFAAQGPNVSLRDIAADANVNLGLMHRHFGSKEAVIRAAFDDAARNGRALVDDADDLPEALRRTIDMVSKGEDGYVRMLAWMLLSQMAPHDLQTEFPTLERLVELGGPDARPTILVTMLVLYGWQVFADQLLVALGYDPSEKDAVSGEVRALLEQAFVDRLPG
jgi:AcrR family transcriptional regulator